MERTKRGSVALDMHANLALVKVVKSVKCGNLELDKLSDLPNQKQTASAETAPAGLSHTGWPKSLALPPLRYSAPQLKWSSLRSHLFSVYRT